MVCYALTYSVSVILILLYRMWCVGAVINGKRALTRVEEALLQEYRLQVARKLTAVESSRDFLRIFVPSNEIDSRFTSMVNETVQKKKGRFFAQGHVLDFDLEMSAQAMEAWDAHGDSVRCSQPHPQMLDMFEELGISRGVGTFIYPSCTWVRRCGGNGCCPSDLQECASVPGTRTNVSKPFVMVTETGIDESSHVVYKDQFLNYTFYEDTACSCQNRPEGELPCSHTTCPRNQGFSVATCGCKCLKDCPAPYIQDPETCGCDCRPGDRPCLKVMRGKTRLPPSACLCVGHGCEQPKCRRHWSFSTARCRCEERAPPLVRGRVHGSIHNEVPVDKTPAPEVEIINEYASGMPLPLTSAETTTIIMPFTPEEEEEEEEEETAGGDSGSSSSSSVDEKTSPEEQDPFGKFVRLPVAPEQRYIGGREHLENQQETRTESASAQRPSSTQGTSVSWEASKVRSHLGEDTEDTTTLTNYDTTETATTTHLGTYSRHRGRFHGHVGLEDDEDEMVAEVGEFGSGSTPMDDED